jgi:arylsulfatase A-like enzyme
MFTANPTTGAAFGFDRGWDTFVAHDPLEGVPASRVFDDAAAWIEAHKSERFFVVVHARGGHPPWDVSPEEERAMQPEGYLGILEASRAAEILAKAHRHAGRFKDDDRVRAWALYDRAVELHDEALGRLDQALATAGRREDTAIIVTADVAAVEAPPVPFVDTDALEESLLATPLVVSWPRAPWLGGRRVEAPTSSVDIARTVLASLQLEPPAAFQGVDLGRVARGAWDALQRPLAATRGEHFAVRWGRLVLVGSGNRELRMCDLSLDPTCVADVRATSPLALEPLHRKTLDLLARAPAAPPTRESAVFDEHTTEALVRWGDLPDRTPEDR